ncbi:MAG: PDZ domain-containing protein [Elusimicrobia bacterium]|nr:PDZ domain-containing protein [Elusimicrobiota bacterium]
MIPNRLGLAVLSVSILAAPVRAASSGAAALQDAFAETAARAKPAVVNISVVQNVQVQAPDFQFGDPEDMLRQYMQGGRPHTYRLPGTGSGFLIDAKGFIVTNDHVVGRANEITVTLAQPDGKETKYSAKVIGRDPSLDLAVVQIQKSDKAFPFLKFADQTPRVGDWAMAIGSPFSLEQTVTVGIISAQRQSMVIEGKRYANMIQTDAAINRGNSGGPLLNLNGEVLGVNTAIFSPSGASAGIGFAIPASQVKDALNYLLAGKRVPRGWLGIALSPVDPVVQRRFALPSPEGALVNQVYPSSPAEKAGIKRGDVIRTFNKTAVASPEDIINAATKLASGKQVPVIIYRKGVPVDLMITLGRRPDWADEPKARGPAEDEESPEDPKKEGAGFRWEGAAFSQEQDGVTVADVKPDSPFAGSLIPGDIVRAVNDHEISSIDGLKTAAKKTKVQDGVFFDILRDGKPRYLSVKP